MRFRSIICALALLADSVLGVVVTGVGGGPYQRREIRQLATYPKQWTLFLLAMNEFQAQSQSDVTGYYQIAGIHGVPRQNYDGVAQCSTCQGADGYCTHDSILFLGWHRTYLALFEQQLVATAKSIANTYPSNQRAAYVNAANKLRLPYWDWAANPPSGSTVLPTQITQATVTVNGPTGKKTMANPLYSYHFSSTSGLVYTPFTHWSNTLRYPTSNAVSATSNEPKDIAAFTNIQPSLQDQVYQVYSTCDTFLEVGLDTASTGTVKCSNSLENIHNTVHTTVGGGGGNGVSGGHMTYLSEAAFDPVFWLHHCNVDRLFAMWQGVYPNSYSGSQAAPATTWTIPQGSIQSVTSPLMPFHSNSAGAFWTTTGVRNWKTFGYTYPEFANSDGSPAAIKNFINELYGPNANATAGSAKRSINPANVISPLIANNGSLFQYVANIETARYALNGSYNIYLFNGDPASEDPTNFIVDPNLIGLMGVLATEAMSSNNLVAAGSVPLTRTLSDVVTSGVLPDLTEASVVPYLVKNLQWRIVNPQGAEVDPSTVPDFDISVYASTASAVSEGQLPVWSTFIPLEDVTKDRAGGTNSTTTTTSSTSPSTSTATSTASSSAS